MNNYCTNCGKKLNPKDKKCPNCQTPVLDIPPKEEPKKTNKFNWSNFFKNTIIIILAILIFLVIYHAYNIYNVKQIIKENFSTDFQKIRITNIEQCHICTNSCDGTCVSQRSIYNCHKYYLTIKFTDQKYLNSYIQYSGANNEKNDLTNIYKTLNSYQINNKIVDKYLTYTKYIQSDTAEIYLDTNLKDNLNIDYVQKIVDMGQEIASKSNTYFSIYYQDNFIIRISYSNGDLTVLRTNLNDDESSLEEYKKQRLYLYPKYNHSPIDYAQILQTLTEWVNLDD